MTMVNFILCLEFKNEFKDYQHLLSVEIFDNSIFSLHEKTIYIVGFLDKSDNELVPRKIFYKDLQDNLLKEHIFEFDKIDDDSDGNFDETIRQLIYKNYGIIEETDLDEVFIDTLLSQLSYIRGDSYSLKDSNQFIGETGIENNKKIQSKIAKNNGKNIHYFLSKYILLSDEVINLSNENFNEIEKLFEDAGSEFIDKADINILSFKR